MKLYFLGMVLALNSGFNQDIFDCIMNAGKKIEFEGTEAEFHFQEIDPLQEVGLTSVREIFIPEKREERICEETGTYEHVIRQDRVVTFLPGKKQIKQCLGHRELHEVNLKEGSPSHKEKKERIKNGKIHWENVFKFNLDVKSFDVT